MAYRNHPTRYLIVKDRVASLAVAGGQQEAATYAALNPASSTFFQNPPTRLSAAASGFPKRRAYLRVPVRPVKHFFQSPFRPFGDPAALPFFAARRELLRIPARPVNTFFHSTRRTAVPRSASPVSVGAEERVYARPPGPSTLFFNPAEVLATPGRARRGFPQREGLSTRGAGGRQRFSRPDGNIPPVALFPIHRPGHWHGLAVPDRFGPNSALPTPSPLATTRHRPWTPLASPAGSG